MFERFTDNARRTVVLAQEEARLVGAGFIGTEHLLLGVLHEGRNIGAQALGECGLELSAVRDFVVQGRSGPIVFSSADEDALKSIGVDLGAVRREVEDAFGPGSLDRPMNTHIPFTPRAKKVLELALREALMFGHDYVSGDHILLGVIREGEGLGAQALEVLKVGGEAVRSRVIALLDERERAQAPDQEWTLGRYQDETASLRRELEAFSVEEQVDPSELIFGQGEDDPRLAELQRDLETVVDEAAAKAPEFGLGVYDAMANPIAAMVPFQMEIKALGEAGDQQVLADMADWVRRTFDKGQPSLDRMIDLLPDLEVIVQRARERAGRPPFVAAPLPRRFDTEARWYAEQFRGRDSIAEQLEEKADAVLARQRDTRLERTFAHRTRVVERLRAAVEEARKAQ